MRRVHRRIKHLPPEVTTYTLDYIIRVNGEFRDSEGYFEGDHFYAYTPHHAESFVFYVVGEKSITRYDAMVSFPRPTEIFIEVDGEIPIVYEYIKYIGDVLESISEEEATEVRVFIQNLLN